jgi:hypothetical protein
MGGFSGIFARNRELARLRSLAGEEFFPGQQLNETSFTRAGPVFERPNRAFSFEIGGLTGRSRPRHDPAINPSAFIPGPLSAAGIEKRGSVNRRGAARGNTASQVSVGSGLTRPGISRGRFAPQSQGPGLRESLLAADPRIQRPPSLLAGRGLSLQPLGFNIGLSRLQNPELFAFENAEEGGFSVPRDAVAGLRRAKSGLSKKEKKAQSGLSDKVLLTGRIRRRKLTNRGSILPPDIAPPPPPRTGQGSRGVVTKRI